MNYEVKKNIEKLIEQMENSKKEFIKNNFNFESDKIAYEFNKFENLMNFEINSHKFSDIFTKISNSAFNLDFVSNEYELLISNIKKLFHPNQLNEFEFIDLISEFISCVDKLANFQNYLQMCLCFLSTLRTSNKFENNIEQLKKYLEKLEEYKAENEELKMLKNERIGGFILKYPQFEKHLKLLQESGFIEITENGFLKWNGNKSTLAKYINYISETENTDWKIAENIFQVKNLYANYKKETSDDEFMLVKKLIDIKNQ